MIMSGLADGASEPFASNGLDALLATAAKNAPDTVLIRDDASAATGADLQRRTCRLASSLRLAGLRPGERVLIVAGAQTASIVCLIAALRAGLEPALTRCGLDPVELAAHARSANASAIVGPSVYGGVSFGDLYLSAAAIAESVRLIATHGPDSIDGAIDISAEVLDALPDPPDEPAHHQPAMIATFQGPASSPTLIRHRQASLLADALSLAEQARIAPSRRIVSTLPPATLAGLVAGPFATLIGASSLVLHGPFDARRFLAVCDEEPGFHLVVPAAVGELYDDPRLAADVTSLILLSRFADAGAYEPLSALVCERPIVDLYAFGEDTVLAQRRVDGEARPPARITDKSLTGGLGAKLNRARSETRAFGSER